MHHYTPVALLSALMASAASGQETRILRASEIPQLRKEALKLTPDCREGKQKACDRLDVIRGWARPHCDIRRVATGLFCDLFKEADLPLAERRYETLSASCRSGDEGACLALMEIYRIHRGEEVARRALLDDGIERLLMEVARDEPLQSFSPQSEGSVIVARLKDPRLLVQIARSSRSAPIIAAALRKLAGESRSECRMALLDLAKSTDDAALPTELREAVFSVVVAPDLLADIATTAPTTGTRRRATRLLKDQQTLVGLASTSDDVGVCAAAIARLQDPALLASVARQAQNPLARQLAVENLTDRALLGAIVQQDSTAEVRGAAAVRLSDLRTAATAKAGVMAGIFRQSSTEGEDGCSVTLTVGSGGQNLTDFTLSWLKPDNRAVVQLATEPIAITRGKFSYSRRGPIDTSFAFSGQFLSPTEVTGTISGSRCQWRAHWVRSATRVLVPRETQTMRDINLTPQPVALPKGEGELRLRVRPAEARVYVEGVFAGMGSDTLTLRSGRHRIEIAHGDYVTVQREVTVVEGLSAPLVIDLVKAP